MEARARSARWVAVLLFAIGCQSGATPTPTETDQASPGEPTEAVVSPEQRVATPRDRARFAFGGDGDLFSARHSTHAVTVRGGVLAIKPFDHRDGVREGDTIWLETLAIARGDTTVETVAPRARVDADSGHLVIDRGPVRETIENFADGVEQSWRFDAAPIGSGDVTVKVAMNGHRFVSTTKSGLHFQGGSGLGFRYGHATWIDADGNMARLPSTWDGQSIVINVPEDVLTNSSYPAVLDPVVAAEIAVDNPVVGSTGVGSLRSAIASSGAGFLAVWVDGRNAAGSDIFGTRLTAAGAIQDNLGIAVDEGAGVQDNPAVAFAGGTYVVAWDDGAAVSAATVSTGGAVAALGGIGAGVTPQIASRGGQALLVYQSGGEVRGALFDGLSFQPSFAITTGAVASAPSVAANPAGDYLVTWSDGAVAPNLRGQFVTAAGALSGAAFDISAGAGGQNQGSVAFNGTDFVAVWSNNNNGVDIYGTRVTTAGAVLDTHLESMVAFGGKPLSVAANTQNQPDVACSGTTCLATWSDRRTFATLVNDVYALRLDGTLNAIGTDVAVAALADEQRAPAVTNDGTGWRLTWHDKRHGGADTTFSARVAADGSLPDGSGASIVTGHNREIGPAIKASATNWMVAWSDSRILGNNIMGVRFNGAGSKLDATALTVSNAAGQQGNAALTFDGTNYLALWNDTRNGTQMDIFAARMTVTGILQDTGGIAVSTAQGDQQRPAAANGGGITLAVWQSPGTGFDIYGALIDAAGVVQMTDIPICVNPGSQVDPSVAFDTVNGVFLVTWNDNRTGNDDVYATRVTPAGAVLDGTGVAVSGATGGQFAAEVTYGAGNFFVSWTDARSDVAGDVYGARVSAAGGVLTVIDAAGIALASGAAAQGESATAFVTPNLYVTTYSENGDIYARTLLTNGNLDGAAFVVSNNGDVESNPSITAGPSGKPAMIAYERQRPDLDTLRVATRRVTFSGNTGSTCMLDSQCVSGFCVDSRCCDVACGGTNKTDCQACSVGAGAQVDGTCAVILDTTKTCRNYADTFCDRVEKCDGVSAACPDDLGRRQGITCDVAGGGTGTCPANDVTGSPHVCQ